MRWVHGSSSRHARSPATLVALRFNLFLPAGSRKYLRRFMRRAKEEAPVGRRSRQVLRVGVLDSLTRTMEREGGGGPLCAFLATAGGMVGLGF